VARGGFVFDITWKDGKLANFKMKSRVGGKVDVRYGIGSNLSGKIENTSGGGGGGNFRLQETDVENKVAIETEKDNEYEFKVTWE
jgi:hypothetical protein